MGKATDGRPLIAPADATEYLIDGYNLLHARPRAGHRGDASLEARRERLLRLLETAAALAGVRCTVVWDGAGERIDEPESGPDSLIRSIFTDRRTLADSLIERLTYASTASFVVVTSDRAVAAVCRGRGARVLACREFERDVLDPVLADPRGRGDRGDRPPGAGLRDRLSGDAALALDRTLATTREREEAAARSERDERLRAAERTRAAARDAATKSDRKRQEEAHEKVRREEDAEALETFLAAYATPVAGSRGSRAGGADGAGTRAPRRGEELAVVDPDFDWVTAMDATLAAKDSPARLADSPRSIDGSHRSPRDAGSEADRTQPKRNGRSNRRRR